MSVAPSDPDAVIIAALRTERKALLRRVARLDRRLNRVRRLNAELRTIAPLAAILIDGVLER